jgi:hypothetical protein
MNPQGSRQTMRVPRRVGPNTPNLASHLRPPERLNLTVGEVNASLDRTLPQIDNAARLRHISIDLHRLDELLKTFFARATEKADAQAGLLVVKILERKAALLGLDQPTKLDVVQMQAQEEVSSHEQVKQAIGPDWRPNGPSGAVDTLSSPDDDEITN